MCPRPHERTRTALAERVPDSGKSCVNLHLQRGKEEKTDPIFRRNPGAGWINKATMGRFSQVRSSKKRTLGCAGFACPLSCLAHRGKNTLRFAACFDAAGIPENSRRLSEATPPEGRPPGTAPRQGVPETTRGTNPLPPLCGVGCFWDRVPGVLLRSIPGYHLCSLREQCPRVGCAPGGLVIARLPRCRPRKGLHWATFGTAPGGVI